VTLSQNRTEEDAGDECSLISKCIYTYYANICVSIHRFISFGLAELYVSVSGSVTKPTAEMDWNAMCATWSNSWRCWATVRPDKLS